MPKLGRFTSAEAKTAYLRHYDAVAAQWPVSSVDSDIETSFGVTRVRKSGSGGGAPILLLPGLSGNGLLWRPFVAEFARDRAVYAPDVIGWPGRSVQTAPVRDGADIAEWMVEVFDGLGLDRVHLAGGSMGSWLASQVGVHHPERLASLTMFEPSAATFTKPPLRVLLKFFGMGMRPSPEGMRKFNQWLTPGVEHTGEEWEMMVAGMKFRSAMPWDRPLTDEQLAAITAPMLVLYGAETVINDPEAGARRVRDHVASAEVEIYPGAGHELLWGIPDRVVPRFLEFVRKHDSVCA
ncbi:alpha/beta fold hydrolase [Nocardia sp. NPDC051750]|uniref:alpha/beta fold hydrolase n=1 Tax=Nocardia sp. NPDC051750 TaxID=3364325 RepID=UPI0037AF192A